MDTKTRIAIVDSGNCRPNNCSQHCKKSCPIEKTGKLCIDVSKDSKISIISETRCIGCGICAKKCPFEAIRIINLPSNLEIHTTHRYGHNTFKLHKLPVPKVGQVLGLVGSNGTGKSTVLKILAGKLKPNLGKFENPPDWPEIINYFRGSELEAFFGKLVEKKLKTVIKPQYIDAIGRAAQGKVQDYIESRNQRKVADTLIKELAFEALLERDVDCLSGGELQLFAILVTAIQEANIYMFDEPSSYLDIRQRLKVSQVIRDILNHENCVIAVEHDLAILDYLSDYVCVLNGIPGAYGVVTFPFGVGEGINIFLDGFIPKENMRFRDMELSFRVSDGLESTASDMVQYKYPQMQDIY